MDSFHPEIIQFLDRHSLVAVSATSSSDHTAAAAFVALEKFWYAARLKIEAAREARDQELRSLELKFPALSR